MTQQHVTFLDPWCVGGWNVYQVFAKIFHFTTRIVIPVGNGFLKDFAKNSLNYIMDLGMRLLSVLTKIC